MTPIRQDAKGVSPRHPVGATSTDRRGSKGPHLNPGPSGAIIPSMEPTIASQSVLALGRAAKVAVVDQLLSAFPDLGRTRLIQSLQDLEHAGLAERLDGNAWLFPHQGKPRLSFSRTWSKPDGVAPDVEISATLANPRLVDLAELCLAYSERRVRANLEMLIREDALRPRMIDRVGSMLDNIHAGFVTAARRRYERSLSGCAS